MLTLYKIGGSDGKSLTVYESEGEFTFEIWDGDVLCSSIEISEDSVEHLINALEKAWVNC